MRNLGLTNSFGVYWIPAINSAWTLLVIRTYMRGLSESFIESAKMEGANEFWIFIRIIMPLCIPVLACMVLFAAVFQWNFWWDTFVYNSEKLSLTTLQYELMRKLKAIGQTKLIFSPDLETGNAVTPQSLRAAMVIIVSIPIICVYPLAQRYFITGLTIGGVKG